MYINTLAYLTPLLFGQWQLWHSNHPYYSTKGNVNINIFPENKIEVIQKYPKGIFIIQKREEGLFFLPQQMSKNKNSSSTPSFSSAQPIFLSLQKEETKFLSILGIGLDNLAIVNRKRNLQKIRLFLYMISNDDLYLTTKRDRLLNPPSADFQDEVCFHMIRKLPNNEAKIDVPITSFFISTILSNLIIIWFHFIIMNLFHVQNSILTN